MKVEYQIVRGPFNVGFNSKVEEMLAEGWKLQGGVAVDQDEYVYQALYRETGAQGNERSPG